jgi:DNA-binding CsgD family transcriptional regulator
MNQLDRIEWKLDQILASLLSTSNGEDGGKITHAEHHQIPHLTTKQHATLQMLMRGASNLEIAQRFGVSDNTAKVHVRTIAKKFGVNTRSQIVLKALPIFEVDDNSYRLASGGLPKDWDEQYTENDPFEYMYRSKNASSSDDTE